MTGIDKTHDPDATSWVESANNPESEFPIQNLPFCAFQAAGRAEHSRIGVGIGDMILDLTAAKEEGLLDPLSADIVDACGQSDLNALMSLGPAKWKQLRHQVFGLVNATGTDAARERSDRILVAQDAVTYRVPARVGDYTDYSASFHHGARTRAARGRQEANPINKFYLPAAYHGRTSSIVISGTPVTRPKGMITSDSDAPLEYAPTKELDFELEIAFYVGPGTGQGQTVSLADAEDHIFGCCLMNDWSARDVQLWEGPRLGPYLAKSFSTAVSPWIITLDALAPFRSSRLPFTDEDPPPPPHLQPSDANPLDSFDVTLEAFLTSEKMRADGTAPRRICESNLRYVYWSLAQLLVHQGSNGCNLVSGDLIATGTVSGPMSTAAGCLLEMVTGDDPNVRISPDEMRRYLEDGDEVNFRGEATADGYRSIGFGECSGRIVPTP